MSFWGATVITNVRGRKVPKTRRFTGNSLLPEKGSDKLSSFQTAKKSLWKIKHGAVNNKQDILSIRDMEQSNCIFSIKYLTGPIIVRCIMFLNNLRDTLVSFRETHATAVWQILNHTGAEPIKAEGRFNNIQETGI
jgi:hypothetical protein